RGRGPRRGSSSRRPDRADGGRNDDRAERESDQWPVEAERERRQRALSPRGHRHDRDHERADDHAGGDAATDAERPEDPGTEQEMPPLLARRRPLYREIVERRALAGAVTEHGEDQTADGKSESDERDDDQQRDRPARDRIVPE